MFCVNDFGGGGRYCPDVLNVYSSHFNVYSVFKQIIMCLSRLDWRPSTIFASYFVVVFNCYGKCLNVFKLLTMCESKFMTFVSFTFPIVLEVCDNHFVFFNFNCHVINIAYYQFAVNGDYL